MVKVEASGPRRGGRTYRLLKEAVKAANAAVEVFFLVADVSQIDVVVAELVKSFGCKRIHMKAVRVPGGGAINIITNSDSNIDWRDGRVVGSNLRLFADHYARERRLESVLSANRWAFEGLEGSLWWSGHFLHEQKPNPCKTYEPGK